MQVLILFIANVGNADTKYGIVDHSGHVRRENPLKQISFPESRSIISKMFGGVYYKLFAETARRF